MVAGLLQRLGGLIDPCPFLVRQKRLAVLGKGGAQRLQDTIGLYLLGVGAAALTTRRKRAESE